MSEGEVWGGDGGGDPWGDRGRVREPACRRNLGHALEGENSPQGEIHPEQGSMSASQSLKKALTQLKRYIRQEIEL
jgi:hypothetical protein